MHYLLQNSKWTTMWKVCIWCTFSQLCCFSAPRGIQLPIYSSRGIPVTCKQCFLILLYLNFHLYYCLQISENCKHEASGPNMTAHIRNTTFGLSHIPSALWTSSIKQMVHWLSSWHIFSQRVAKDRESCTFLNHK